MEKDRLIQHNDSIGSITIVGSGIAGIQTALDIANSGFKVRVVEEKPNVGGVGSAEHVAVPPVHPDDPPGARDLHLFVARVVLRPDHQVRSGHDLP